MNKVAFSLFERVQAERDYWRERAAQLEKQLVADVPLPAAWALSPGEARVFRHLLKRGRASHDSLMTVLYGDRPEPPGEAILNVWIFKLRQKLRPFGITITNIHGAGYELPAEDRGFIFSLIDGRDPIPDNTIAQGDADAGV
ncbi:MAG: helix-turn-helix domain-containing protein [Roseibium sp.]|nr:helix-turn-helix domain-containing protein [Roseibium sp.]